MPHHVGLCVHAFKVRGIYRQEKYRAGAFRTVGFFCRKKIPNTCWKFFLDLGVQLSEFLASIVWLEECIFQTKKTMYGHLYCLTTNTIMLLGPFPMSPLKSDPGSHAVQKFRVSAHENPRLLLLLLSFPSLDHNKPAGPALLDPPPAADRVRYELIRDCFIVVTIQ